MKKVISVVGARPNFIKLDSTLSQMIVHTGQHYDDEMSQVFFDDLNLKAPKYNLNCKDSEIGAMITKLDNVYRQEKPDLIIVYGDTNSTSAGAIAAFPLRIKVAHVEAGLRAHRRHMLEEYNRVVSDHIADYNFCPTPTAVKNLKNEGIKNGYFVGDVMFDRIISTRKKIGPVKPKDFFLLTTHRAENVDKKEYLSTLLNVLGKLRVNVLFPIHPRTRKRLKEFKLTLPPNIAAVTPLSHTETIRAILESVGVITDSGGVQKEAYFCQKPCLILRDETEWEEIVDGHSVILLPPAKVSRLSSLLKKPLPSPRLNRRAFGNGQAWQKIKRILNAKGFI